MRRSFIEAGCAVAILSGFAGANLIADGGRHGCLSAAQSETAGAAPAKSTLQNLPAIFVGNLPCADCPGIRYRLDLRKDHTYSSSMTYEDRNASFADGGRWELTEDGNVLVLHGGRSSTSKLKLVDADTLRQLDGDGHEINSKLNYDLKREPSSGTKVGRGNNASPENTHWSLIGLGDAPVKTDSLQKEAFLMLNSATHRVSGSGGCNNLMGSYEVDGSRLRFGQTGSSMMFCAKGMETERGFLQALARVSTWKIDEGHLELFDSSGKLLAQFKAKAGE